MVQRWSDINASIMRRLVHCAPTGNITAGWPNCASPNTILTMQNFDASLQEGAAEETLQTEWEETGSVDTALLSALYNLLDWQVYYQYQPIISNFSTHSQPYGLFTFPWTTAVADAQQSALLALSMDAHAFMFGYCGNCSYTLSGTTPQAIGDDMFAHALDLAGYNIIGAKQNGQLYQGLRPYIQHRTDPGTTGWAATLSEASSTLYTYNSSFPNLLGPYPEFDFPKVPSCTSAGVCTWFSAPATTPFIRVALSPSDPWAGTQFTGTQGSCNTNANLCIDTATATGLPNGTYNVAFGCR